MTVSPEDRQALAEALHAHRSDGSYHDANPMKGYNHCDCYEQVDWFIEAGWGPLPKLCSEQRCDRPEGHDGDHFFRPHLPGLRLRQVGWIGRKEAVIWRSKPTAEDGEQYQQVYVIEGGGAAAAWKDEAGEDAISTDAVATLAADAVLDVVRPEIDRWEAKCDEVGIPHDPDALVRHHRGNAGMVGAADAMASWAERERVLLGIIERLLTKVVSAKDRNFNHHERYHVCEHGCALVAMCEYHRAIAEAESAFFASRQESGAGSVSGRTEDA
jgi:hypothetical protein